MSDTSSLSLLLPSPPEPPLLPQERRIELALEHWQEPNNTLLKSKIAQKYGIPRRTFFGRTEGRQARAKAHEKEQRLAPGEEQALLEWVLRLQKWGWPPRVEQSRFMANELLRSRNDYNPVGINWAQKFMRRHPIIRTAYIPPLDKERVMAEDPTIFSAWFNLYQEMKTTYKVEDSDTYNMDEKGFM